MKVEDKEFRGWQPMNSLLNNENYWIYFSPDNTEAALVNTINNEVIFIMDRASGEQTYKCPNAQRHAQFFYAVRGTGFEARKVI